MDLRWEILAPYQSLFVSGIFMTIKLTLVAIVVGLFLGLLIGLVTSQKPKGWLRVPYYLLQVYVGVLRGTPLFVQILLVHFALMPTLISPNTACCSVARLHVSSVRLMVLSSLGRLRSL